MRWLIDLKEHYRDPVDCWRLALSPNASGRVISGRWWFTSGLASQYHELWLEKQRRIRESNRKLALAHRYEKIFKYLLPFVEFVGVTGSVSSLAAKPSDDIDFIIVCQPRRVALTRLADWFIFNLLRIRRNRQTNPQQYQDRFCFNFYLDTKHLAITEHSAKNALELAEIIPLFDRNGGTYRQLLLNNNWLQQRLGKWYQQSLAMFPADCGKAAPRISVGSWLLDRCDQLAGWMQQRQIAKHNHEFKPEKHVTRLQFWKEQSIR